MSAHYRLAKAPHDAACQDPTRRVIAVLDSGDIVLAPELPDPPMHGGSLDWSEYVDSDLDADLDTPCQDPRDSAWWNVAIHAAKVDAIVQRNNGAEIYIDIRKLRQ